MCNLVSSSVQDKGDAVSGLQWRAESEKQKYAYVVNSVMVITFQENNWKSTASSNTWKFQNIFVTDLLVNFPGGGANYCQGRKGFKFNVHLKLIHNRKVPLDQQHVKKWRSVQCTQADDEGFNLSSRDGHSAYQVAMQAA
jgi:hypothetical protein